VAAMEDVIDLYHEPYDADRPLVCLDEQPRQLIRETRIPVPAARGRPAREDFQYEREGTANLFLVVEPLAGWRHVEVTERRTAVDWAHQIRWLLDERYPAVKQVRLVCDNLNTHKVASLYEAFEPEEARRLARRLDIHYTPKHGSWLDVAEVELSALSHQCLDRRIPDAPTLRAEVAAWEHDLNTRQRGVDWRFTTKDARIKLKRLYPQIVA
jgi:hypothetical protein